MRPEKVDFLSGWADIAEELGKSISTVQRWHKERPLPLEYVCGTPTTTRAKLQAWADGPGKATAKGGSR